MLEATLFLHNIIRGSYM